MLMVQEQDGNTKEGSVLVIMQIKDVHCTVQYLLSVHEVLPIEGRRKFRRGGGRQEQQERGRRAVATCFFVRILRQTFPYVLVRSTCSVNSFTLFSPVKSTEYGPV